MCLACTVLVYCSSLLYYINLSYLSYKLFLYTAKDPDTGFSVILNFSSKQRVIFYILRRRKALFLVPLMFEADYFPR